MACYVPKPCEFPSLDRCQKMFLWTQEEVDPALHPVIGFLLQVGDAERLPHALGFENLDPFFRGSKQGPRFMAIEAEINLTHKHEQLYFTRE